MKTILSSLLVFASVCSAANATNHFSIAAPSLTPGNDATIEINLENEDRPTGLQFSLILPDGISLKTSGRGGEAITAFSVGDRLNEVGEQWSITNANDLGNNVYEVISAQLANREMYPASEDLAYFGSTTIIKVAVNVSTSYTGGAFGLKDTKLSKAGSYYENTNEGIFDGTLTLSLGANGYSSYSTCAPVQVAGATVKGATISGNKLNLSGTGSSVPANTGVILKGTEGATVTITAASSSVAPIPTDLTAAVVPTTVEANKTMVLSTKTGVTGFYVFTGTTITANKAYLASIPTGAPLRIIDDEVTGIEEVEAETNVGFNYNLMGQQIKSQKGFAIENGKKVVRF